MIYRRRNDLSAEVAILSRFSHVAGKPVAPWNYISIFIRMNQQLVTSCTALTGLADEPRQDAGWREKWRSAVEGLESIYLSAKMLTPRAAFVPTHEKLLVAMDLANDGGIQLGLGVEEGDQECIAIGTEKLQRVMPALLEVLHPLKEGIRRPRPES